MSLLSFKYLDHCVIFLLTKLFKMYWLTVVVLWTSIYRISVSLINMIHVQVVQSTYPSHTRMVRKSKRSLCNVEINTCCKRRNKGMPPHFKFVVVFEKKYTRLQRCFALFNCQSKHTLLKSCVHNIHFAGNTPM